MSFSSIQTLVHNNPHDHTEIGPRLYLVHDYETAADGIADPHNPLDPFRLALSRGRYYSEYPGGGYHVRLADDSVRVIGSVAERLIHGLPQDIFISAPHIDGLHTDAAEQFFAFANTLGIDKPKLKAVGPGFTRHFSVRGMTEVLVPEYVARDRTVTPAHHRRIPAAPLAAAGLRLVLARTLQP